MAEKKDKIVEMKATEEKKIKPWHILLGIGIIVLVMILWFVGTYNGLVSSKEGVDNSWAQVENQYQRRADLIPNLVSTVQGFATQEKTIFIEVAEKRSAWTNANTRDEQIDAARGMDSAISRLLVVAENYPQLKSNENFLGLQASLEGTENRIAVERMRFNDAVKAYNIKIKRIPTVIIANMFGYDEEKYFEVSEEDAKVPQVQFN